MPVEQDFLPFGIGAGANVVDQATYAAAASTGFVAVGFAAGLAQSNLLNKVWRQSSVMAFIVGQMISDELVIENVLDNTDVDTLLDQFKRALGIAAQRTPTLEITASANVGLTATQRMVGLFRVTGLGAFNITLPTVQDGDSITIQDVLGGLNGANVTVIPPSGNIRNQNSFTMVEDFMTAKFTYYETGNTWGVALS